MTEGQDQQKALITFGEVGKAFIKSRLFAKPYFSVDVNYNESGNETIFTINKEKIGEFARELANMYELDHFVLKPLLLEMVQEEMARIYNE